MIDKEILDKVLKLNQEISTITEELKKLEDPNNFIFIGYTVKSDGFGLSIFDSSRFNFNFDEVTLSLVKAHLQLVLNMQLTVLVQELDSYKILKDAPN